MRRRLLPGLAVGLLLAAVPAQAQDEVRALIERAVKAHGGAERLSRLRADRVKLKGTLKINGKDVAFTGETTVQLPAQFKNVLQLTVDNRALTLVQILNGDQAHVTLDGQPQKIETAALAEMRDKMNLSRIVRLMPLLSDKAYTLAALPEAKVNDRPVDGVKVTAKGQREARMYFDRETNLLVKTELPLTDGAGKELGREEHVYGDFRDLSGYRRPVRMVSYRNGTKVADVELTEVKYFDRLDDSEFAKP